MPPASGGVVKPRIPVLFWLALAALALVTALVWSEPAGSGCPWDPDCAVEYEEKP